MPLAAHTRLGPYEITGSIGAGGMGEIYAAHDHRLHRDVALKVLPPLFASDPDRMARFNREAQLLASLNHARIASLYGLEESGDIRALVMELVPGPTLADRLVSGPIPVDEALIYARQIAEALEYAHERGVIHRDLKPANIKVTPDGDVKVLDFGLAKALDTTRVAAALADSPTLTIASTGAGVIMGTAAYMSPEQAAGGTVDRRSDVFSFGSVLFEMLAGRSAFGGGSGTEVLAAVLKSEPGWNALPATTPGVVRSLLRRCLTKDRKQRLQAIGEARIVLEAPRDAASEPSARRIAAPTLAWTIAGLSLVVAGVLLWERFTPAPQAPRVVTRFGVPFDTSGPPLPLGIAISRDGARLVFSAGAKIQLYLREFGQLDARPIPDTVGGRAPAFSPDGERLVFVGGNAELKTISLSGGGAQVITPSGVRVIAPATWDADDRILYGTSRGLMRVPVRGGMPETLVPIGAHLQPGETDGVVLGAKMLRDGRGVLYNVGKSSGKLEAAVLDFSTGRHTRLNSVNGFIVGVTAGSCSSTTSRPATSWRFRSTNSASMSPRRPSACWRETSGRAGWSATSLSLIPERSRTTRRMNERWRRISSCGSIAAARNNPYPIQSAGTTPFSSLPTATSWP
jgi:serine/threonine-protein kinase